MTSKEIRNKVTESSLVTIDLETLFPHNTISFIDIN